MPRRNLNQVRQATRDQLTTIILAIGWIERHTPSPRHARLAAREIERSLCKRSVYDDAAETSPDQLIDLALTWLRTTANAQRVQPQDSMPRSTSASRLVEFRMRRARRPAMFERYSV